MVTTPAATPVTKPEDEPMEATAGLELLHVPPGGVQLKVVVPPAHTLNVPVIGPICENDVNEINNAKKNK